MSRDLQRRLAEHLWTVHNWQLMATQIDNAEHLARAAYDLRGNHAMEHVAGAGQKYSGWREHGHESDLEATVR